MGCNVVAFLCTWVTKEKKRKEKKRKEKLRKQRKVPHINKGKEATWEEKPLHQKRRKQSVRIRSVAGRQASRLLLIGSKVRRMLKRNWSEQAYEHNAQNAHGA